MEASIGRALREARLRKNISLEEAALATKTRAERLEELERDEYSHFPSLPYARGFLILYAKYLDVDPAQYPMLDIGRPVFTADYQYLAGETIGSIRSAGSRRSKPIRRTRWLLAFGIFAVATTIGAITAFVILDFQRLPNLDTLLKGKEATAEAPAESGAAPAGSEAAPPAEEPAPTPEPLPVAPETLPLESLDAEDEAPLSPEAEGAPAVPEQTPEATAASDANALSEPLPAVSPAPEAAPEPPPQASPSASPTPEPSATPEVGEHEIQIQVTKRTRVKVIRDGVRSQPAFNNWLEPGMPPLILRGKQFSIESPNPGALKVTSDGKPVQNPAQSRGANRKIEVQ